MTVSECWDRLQRMTSGSTTPSSDTGRGRPLGFERDQLVDALMRAFWQLGWHGASYPKLEQHTGVARSSMGNTIGAKSDLLAAALDRYLQVIDERLIAPLREGGHGVADVRAFYRNLRAGKRTEPGRWGCLMAITMTEVGTEDPAAARRTLDYRDRLTAAFRAALKRGEASGELAPGTAELLPAALTSTTIGLNVTARAGATTAELDAIVTGVDRLLDLTRTPTA